MEENNDVIKRKIEKYIILLSVINESSKTYIDFKKLQEYCDKLNIYRPNNSVDYHSPLWIIK